MKLQGETSGPASCAKLAKRISCSHKILVNSRCLHKGMKGVSMGHITLTKPCKEVFPHQPQPMAPPALTIAIGVQNLEARLDLLRIVEEALQVTWHHKGCGVRSVECELGDEAGVVVYGRSSKTHLQPLRKPREPLWWRQVGPILTTFRAHFGKS